VRGSITTQHQALVLGRPRKLPTIAISAARAGSTLRQASETLRPPPAADADMTQAARGHSASTTGLLPGDGNQGGRCVTRK
jgi:hypothetical protein